MSKRITTQVPAALRRYILLAAVGVAASFSPNALAVGPIPETAVPSVIVNITAEPIAQGKYEPTWDSIKQYGSAPEWFRDAKFGIWAHWGPQCQPEIGDWYARDMYYEGTARYKFQVEKYGHPSKAGFKEVIHDWKVENWDPEKLVAFYKSVGAQYFFAMGNHHDNLDMWDSKYQPWNTVKVGPRKDIIDGWARAARNQGLRFGISLHAAHAWSWYEGSQLADKTGPLAGVPYDGKLTKADGKGLWWDGLDPQDLYAQNHALTPDNYQIGGVHKHWEWQNLASLPDQTYCDKFYNRSVDVVNKYKPDLIYFDDSVLPLWPVSDMGLKFAAHYYNANANWHNGKNEAVLFGKELKGAQTKALVCDFERRVFDRIMPEPWQTCDCIGDWHYNRDRYNRNRYRSATSVIHELIDVVSKNGNLLLNVPVRGDGTIDDKEIKVLEGIKTWLDVNKEGIFSTRPWKTFGESTPQGGKKLDIRFTISKDGKTLYAITLGRPTQGKLIIRSLAKPNSVKSVNLLGRQETLAWTQTENGLEITFPSQNLSDIASTFVITGTDLQPVPISGIIKSGADGRLTLTPADAETHGSLRVEERGGRACIGYWENSADWLSWQVKFQKAGSYHVKTECAAGAGASRLVLEAAGQKLSAAVDATGGWEEFRAVSFGTLEIKSASQQEIRIGTADPQAWKPVNLRAVSLIPGDGS
jgi:alpha-L-fucosidase